MFEKISMTLFAALVCLGFSNALPLSSQTLQARTSYEQAMGTCVNDNIAFQGFYPFQACIQNQGATIPSDIVACLQQCYQNQFPEPTYTVRCIFECSQDVGITGSVNLPPLATPESKQVEPKSESQPEKRDPDRCYRACDMNSLVFKSFNDYFACMQNCDPNFTPDRMWTCAENCYATYHPGTTDLANCLLTCTPNSDCLGYPASST